MYRKRHYFIKRATVFLKFIIRLTKMKETKNRRKAFLSFVEYRKQLYRINSMIFFSKSYAELRKLLLH